MNLFNKLKKSNLSWILELKQLFPTIKEFFSNGGEGNPVYLICPELSDLFGHLMGEILNNGAASIINKNYIRTNTDGTITGQMIRPLGYLKATGRDESTGGYTYSLIYLNNDSSTNVGIRGIVKWVNSQGAYKSSTTDPSLPSGQKLEANADRVVSDIDNYIKKHTRTWYLKN